MNLHVNAKLGVAGSYAPRRYEWSRPGCALAIDVRKLARFEQPGHRVTGDRQRRSRRVGWLRLSALRRRRQLPLRLRRAAPARGHRHHRARARAGVRAPRRARARAGRGSDDRQRAHHTRGERFQASSPAIGSATSPHRPSRPAGTAEQNDSSKPCNENGPTPASGPTQAAADAPCRAISASTTGAAYTAHSTTATRRSAAFTLDLATCSKGTGSAGYGYDRGGIMRAFLLRRTLFVIPVLFAVLTVTFVATRIVPGDPAYVIAGDFASKETIDSVRHAYGFDRPLWDQYIRYLDHVVHLDFGMSISTGRPVADDMIRRFPATLELISLALIFALIVGGSFGALAAYRRSSVMDRAVRGVSFILLTIPGFWLAILLLYFFFFKWHFAPAPLGQLSLNDPQPHRLTGAAILDSVLSGNVGALRASVAHAVLPVLSYGVVLCAPIARLVRSSMLEALEADYIRFGKACGLSNRRLWLYALRAALPPVVTFGGILFTFLLGGAVLVERIFSWNGAAQYMADAIQRTDYAAIQAFVLFAGLGSVIVFLIVDLLHVAIDPRVRL